MNSSALVELLDHTAEVVREADTPADPFERQVVGTVALHLAGDLVALVQRLNAEREPYVTTYTVEERLAHRHPGATLEPPKDPPPPPDEDPPKPPPPPPTEGE